MGCTRSNWPVNVKEAQAAAPVPAPSSQANAIAYNPFNVALPIPFDTSAMLGAEGALSCLESFPGPITAATSLAELAAYCGQMRATFESAGRSELALLWGLLQLLCRFDGVLDGSSADENASELLRLLRGSAAAEGAIPSPLATSPASPEAYQLAAHKLESLLLEGQREAACEHAMASGLWADALLISSHMDADTWRAVMTRFANETLAPGSPLKTLYALFAGSGVAAFEAPGSSPGGAAGAATFAPSREASEAAAGRTEDGWEGVLFAQGNAVASRKQVVPLVQGWLRDPQNKNTA